MADEQEGGSLPVVTPIKKLSHTTQKYLEQRQKEKQHGITPRNSEYKGLKSNSNNRDNIVESSFIEIISKDGKSYLQDISEDSANLNDCTNRVVSVDTLE